MISVDNVDKKTNHEGSYRSPACGTPEKTFSFEKKPRKYKFSFDPALFYRSTRKNKAQAAGPGRNGFHK
jgi:hypothetical protein